MAADTPLSSIDAWRNDNLVPGKYRGVAVTRITVPLDAASLTQHLLGRDAYRRTRFVVAHNSSGTAIARVWRDAGEESLFAPITRVSIVSGPDETAYVRSPESDTAIPSELAAAAARLAPGTRAVAVEGLYEHVSFIVNPQPLRVTVRELVPPRPAKLLDQARRVLAVTDDLPPIELIPDLIDMARIAADNPSDDYLVPCRGSGLEVSGAGTWYLDEHPELREWTLMGPERSAQIHQAFYDRPAAHFIDVCPDNRPAIPGALLTKCSLLEHDSRQQGGQVTVPWGSSLAQVEQALRDIAHYWTPAWAPV
jgi:hypothetical protein